jgi:hypothetical protein
VSSLGDGAHSFAVRAIDAARNPDPTPATYAWVSDTQPPEARFTAAPNPALVGRTVTYDASSSRDDGAGLARFEWDLDGDGTFEVVGARSPARSYLDPGTYGVQLRVTDGAGRTAVARADQRIATDGGSRAQFGVSLDDEALFTRDRSVTIRSRWPGFADHMLVSNDGGFDHAVTLPLQVRTAWTLDSVGSDRLSRTVYVRFVRGAAVSETYTDEIILDESLPSVTSARVTPRKGGAAPLLRVRARDRGLSGVGSVQVTNDRRDPQARFRAHRATIRLSRQRGERALSLHKTIYVRVRDRAGNLSAWRIARRVSRAA